MMLNSSLLILELPPRTRRIPNMGSTDTKYEGTTSAYAENTFIKHQMARPTRNYLRVRGEYMPARLVLFVYLELPPRTRRILNVFLKPVTQPGTTSAYAENTDGNAHAVSLKRNYLRVRGEYLLEPVGHQPFWELPPRTRRIPQHPSPAS